MQADEEETAQTAHGQRIAFYHKKAGIQVRRTGRGAWYLSCDKGKPSENVYTADRRKCL